MKKEEVIDVLADLSRITGFRVSLHSPDYGERIAYPDRKRQLCRTIHSIPGEIDKCVECDNAACKIAFDKKGAYKYKCRFGMTEAIAPLYNFGTLTGYLVLGQVFENTCNLEEVSAKLRAVGLDEEVIESAIASIPVVNSDMVDSYISVMSMCARYLTLSNAITSERPTVPQLAKKFISEHYSERIGIYEICREIGCSKSTLITSFKKEYGTTVGAYITEVRLDEAMKMLRLGESKIGEIALATGFSDQSYFSKVFSSRFGITPSEYIAKEDK